LCGGHESVAVVNGTCRCRRALPPARVVAAVHANTAIWHKAGALAGTARVNEPGCSVDARRGNVGMHARGSSGESAGRAAAGRRRDGILQAGIQPPSPDEPNARLLKTV